MFRKKQENAGSLAPDAVAVGIYNPHTMNPDQRRIYDGYFNFQGGGCIFKRKKQMSDREYEQAIAAEIERRNIRGRALDKLGLDESQVSEIEPKEFRNYFYEDGVLLMNGNSCKYQVTWLFFSAEQVFIYDYIFDMCNDSEVERTCEYFYKDITSVYSKDTVKEGTMFTVRKGGCLKKKGVDEEKAYLRTTSFYIIVPGDEFFCSMSSSATVQNMVFAMKQKIREKKAL